MPIEVQPAVSPHLTVDNAAAAIDFYVNALNAVEATPIAAKRKRRRIDGARPPSNAREVTRAVIFTVPRLLRSPSPARSSHWR